MHEFPIVSERSNPFPDNAHSPIFECVIVKIQTKIVSRLTDEEKEQV